MRMRSTWHEAFLFLGLLASTLVGEACNCEPGCGDGGGDGTGSTSKGDGGHDESPKLTFDETGSDGSDPPDETTGDDGNPDTDDGSAFDCVAVSSEAASTPVDLSPVCVAVPITNPSFEVPEIDPPWERIDSDGSAAGILGWVGEVDVHHSSDLAVAPDGGDQIVDLNQSSPHSIEQSITLVPGAHYRLSFYHGVNHVCVDQANFRVDVGGATREFRSTYSDAVPIRQASFYFTAKQEQTTVRFTSLTGGSCGPTIDAVSIECVDISETKVFGQPNAMETVPNAVTMRHAFHPQGAVVDRYSSPNRLYVWDSGNGRALGFASLGSCDGSGPDCTSDSDCDAGTTCIVDPEKEADLVFGQIDGTSATCNGDNTRRMSATETTLCGQYYPKAISLLESADPSAMAVDSSGALYLTDKFNHRVLRYDDPFGTCDTVADFVYGQVDFIDRECNRGAGTPSSDSLCFNDETGNHLSGALLGSGVDADDDFVWVTDGANHRVLRFPRSSSDADLVLGQLDFASASTASCGSSPGSFDSVHLCRPKVVRYDPDTDRVFVIDWPHDVELFRVMIFEAPFSSGMAASQMIYGSPTGANGEHWNRPNGLELDPEASGSFWLVDANHSRILRYVESPGGWVADKVLSQPDLVQVGELNVHCPAPNANADCLVDHPGGSMGIDSDTNIYVSDLSLQRIMRFPAPVPDAGALGGEAHPSDARILGAQPDVQLIRPINRVTGSELLAPNNVLVVEYSSGSPPQMIVTDQYRVLVWNDFLARPTGATADVVLFQDDFERMLDGFGHPLQGLDADSSGRLFIGAGHEVHVYQGPIVADDGPIAVVPADIPLAGGGGMLTNASITGIAYDEAEDALWIADTQNHRVVRVSQPLDDTARAVDKVLGQPSLVSTEANRGVDMAAAHDCPNVVEDGFGNLGMIELDQDGNLYVVDATHEGWQCSNNRIVEYDHAALSPVAGTIFFANGVLRPARVYGATSFTSKGGGNGEDSLNTPIGLAFDAENRMIVTADAYGNPEEQRVYLYGNPLRCAAPCAVRDDAALPVTVSQASDAAWDSAGNLLVLDQTWARILLLSATDVAPFLPAAN